MPFARLHPLGSEHYRALVAIASDRLARRVGQDFGGVAAVEPLLAEIEGERLQAAVVLWAKADFTRLQEALAMANLDWRDALIRAGLENADWPQRLDAELGA